MIVNKYDGKCEHCGRTVPAETGFVHFDGDDWLVSCEQCESIPEIPRPARLGKCKICTLSKRPELINEEGVCVDCA